MSAKRRGSVNDLSSAYLEDQYAQYLRDPDSYSNEWQAFFERLEEQELGSVDQHDVIQQRLREHFREPHTAVTRVGIEEAAKLKQTAVLHLIDAYRAMGHRQADIDPLHMVERAEIDQLSPEYHGLSREDYDLEFRLKTGDKTKKMVLRDILNMLSSTYCGSVGAEFEHISEPEQKNWLRNRMENEYLNLQIDPTQKRFILERLIGANALEVYLHKKYVGQKRFSLEGGTSLIPLLETVLERSSMHGVKETIIGMAHRGRLNVLVNIMGKSTHYLFQEFEDTIDPAYGSGDVKYHKGFSIDRVTPFGVMHTVLAFNPSHLEVIDPVVEGSVRARQDRRGDTRRLEVLPVLVHGDAAFAGQGIVMETLNLSSTRGYTTGGTIHVVVNNQIGFTTSDPLDSRSTLYCTDVAKMVQAPIFHVNGDDPEAVLFVTELAADFRAKFKSDVVIDLICYRRHGHSEADEPAVTQPVMYECIRNKQSVDEIYFNQLLNEGVVDQDYYKNFESSYIHKLERNEMVCCTQIAQRIDTRFMVDYRPFLGTSWNVPTHTGISRERVMEIGRHLSACPEHFKVHRSVQKILNARRQMTEGKLEADWGFAELLAYGSLLQDGYGVRLAGQDSVRGTFFHRHSAIIDQNTSESYIPLRHLFEGQPDFLPINSLLSEEAALGFEVGYSTAEPGKLVIWEAQFGDFVNNAQVMIDQFLSSSEAKWQRYCGLVMFLPHGYDGQGPEHSSARPERFLQLCAEENMQVCIPTTPAQMFHLLRRQMVRPYRKPLIVFTPKSLLRHHLSVSSIEKFTDGSFEVLIKDNAIDDVKKVRQLIFCTGKVYFDLLEARNAHQLDAIAIIRMEQLYPFPLQEVRQQLELYSHVSDIRWVQEEPRNQGAWFYMQSRRHLLACLQPGQQLSYTGRDYSASPAVGYLHLHKEQQAKLIKEALNLDSSTAKKLKHVS